MLKWRNFILGGGMQNNFIIGPRGERINLSKIVSYKKWVEVHRNGVDENNKPKFATFHLIIFNFGEGMPSETFYFLDREERNKCIETIDKILGAKNAI